MEEKELIYVRVCASERASEWSRANERHSCTKTEWESVFMSGQYSSNRTMPESIVHNKTRADFNVYYKIVAYASLSFSCRINGQYSSRTRLCESTKHESIPCYTCNVFFVLVVPLSCLFHLVDFNSKQRHCKCTTSFLKPSRDLNSHLTRS